MESELLWSSIPCERLSSYVSTKNLNLSKHIVVDSKDFAVVEQTLLQTNCCKQKETDELFW